MKRSITMTNPRFTWRIADSWSNLRPIKESQLHYSVLQRNRNNKIEWDIFKRRFSTGIVLNQRVMEALYHLQAGEPGKLMVSLTWRPTNWGVWGFDGIKSLSESESLRTRSPNVSGQKIDSSAQAEWEVGVPMPLCSIQALSVVDDAHMHGKGDPLSSVYQLKC